MILTFCLSPDGASHQRVGVRPLVAGLISLQLVSLSWVATKV